MMDNLIDLSIIAMIAGYAGVTLWATAWADTPKLYVEKGKDTTMFDHLLVLVLIAMFLGLVGLGLWSMKI